MTKKNGKGRSKPKPKRHGIREPNPNSNAKSKPKQSWKLQGKESKPSSKGKESKLMLKLQL